MEAVVGAMLMLGFPVLFWVGVWQAVVHGPFQHRYWKGETMPGFAAAVFLGCFAVGFFGPMLVAPKANQGPLLGLLFTGPAGLVLGIVWGVARQRARKRLR